MSNTALTGTKTWGYLQCTCIYVCHYLGPMPLSASSVFVSNKCLVGFYVLTSHLFHAVCSYECQSVTVLCMNVSTLYVLCTMQKDSPLSTTNFEDTFYGTGKKAQKFYFVHISEWSVDHVRVFACHCFSQHAKFRVSYPIKKSLHQS